MFSHVMSVICCVICSDSNYVFGYVKEVDVRRDCDQLSHSRH